VEINKIELKPKEEKNKKAIIKIDKIELKALIKIQSLIRGFLLRKKLKISKSIVLSDDNKLNNNTNNNINITNYLDLISQSTITAKKENIINNNKEKNISIMNFNPNISRSLEFNNEQIADNNDLNINLVSKYIVYYFIFLILKYINFI
jgi:hypothetical protein